MFRGGGALFLDRDGTIVEEIGYITRPDDLKLIPGSAAAIAKFNAAGVRVFVVTNQGGIGKGLMTEQDLGEVHLRMVALLAAEGARVDGIYYCPHHPEGTRSEYAVVCDCRKPAPGMLEQAAREHGVELEDSAIVGDTERDIEAGRAVGAKTVLVRTGYGAETQVAADWVVADLAEASAKLLSDP